MHFTVVIPVFNNQKSLKLICRHVTESFSGVRHDYQILFVDDGSEDDSFATLISLKEQFKQHISILQLEKNYNQSVAIYAGLQHASGSHIMILSADLQEEKALIQNLVSFVEENPDCDMVIGYRENNSDYLIFKLLSRLFYAIIKLRIPKMPYRGFDTGIISAELKDKYIDHYYDGIFIQAMLVQLAYKIGYVGYHRRKSVSNKFRLRSFYFKLQYFFRSISAVYFSQGNNKSGNQVFYQVKQFLP